MNRGRVSGEEKRNEAVDNGQSGGTDTDRDRDRMVLNDQTRGGWGEGGVTMIRR